MNTLLSALIALSPASATEPEPSPAPAAALPGSLTVRYVVDVELGAQADQVCGMTGFCDCQMVYVGAGTGPRVAGELVTWTGTWRREAGNCHEVFAMWDGSPGGKAHHTLALSADRASIESWLAHRDASDIRRAQSGYKERGQVFVDPLALAMATGKPLVHTVTEKEMLSGLSVETTHTLTLTLSPGPPQADSAP